jgi:hypothetical protein
MHLVVDLAIACAARLVACLAQYAAMQHIGKAVNIINFYYQQK